MADIILHHYPQSPVAQKIRFALGIANASWHSVEIPRVPPKPLLMPMTAGYRRTPVVQIGADIHCDTQNIVRALAEFGHADKLFPDGCDGMAMALAGWVEAAMFDLGVRIVLTSVMGTAPPEFIKDRGSLYFEPDWTEESMKAMLPAVILQMQAHLCWVDKMLAKSGYAIGTKPSYADAAIAYIAWFLRGRWDGGADLLTPYENVCALEAELMTKGNGIASDLSGEAALAIALSQEPTSPTGIECGFHADLSMGQKVMVRPRGLSADPDVFGSLRFLDDTRISIDHTSPEAGNVAVHFPIAGYVIKPA